MLPILYSVVCEKAMTLVSIENFLNLVGTVDAKVFFILCVTISHVLGILKFNHLLGCILENNLVLNKLFSFFLVFIQGINSRAFAEAKYLL